MDNKKLGQKHRIHIGGVPITSPMTIKEIEEKHGPIKDLEKDPAIRIIPHTPKPKTEPVKKQFDMFKAVKTPSKHLSRDFLRNTLKDNNISYAKGGKKQTEYHQEEMEDLLHEKDRAHADKWADDMWDKWIEGQIATKKSELSKASRNVREQRQKVWGTNPTPSVGSLLRQKMMDHIVRYAQQRYNMPVERAPGKLNASGKMIDKPELSQRSIQHIGNPASLLHELAHIEAMKQSGMPPDEFQRWMDHRFGEISRPVKHGGYGWKQNAREAEEYESHGAETKMRRQLGLPVHVRETKEKKPERLYAVDRPEKQIAIDVPHAGGQKRITGLSSNLDARKPQFERRQVGIETFSPDKGWTESDSPNALINRRAMGDKLGALRLLRDRLMRKRQNKV